VTAEAQVQSKAPRIFVALKVAPKVAAGLAELASALHESNVRHVRADDIHLTLVPPWNEASTSSAIQKVVEVAERCVPFDLVFKHVSYGPNARHPRLLWVECAIGSELAALQTALMAAFERIEERPFRPHVTLARIRAGGRAIARKHPIGRDLGISQRVTSVELMQSPPTGEVGYTVLASLALGAAENA
jgi:2'-5' RNA ligase